MSSSLKNISGRALTAASLWLFLSGVPLRATTVVFMPFQEQCASAEIIVVATAGPQSSGRDTPQGLIYTETRFQVEETLKGPVAGSLSTRHLGGRVGDIAQSVPGSPSFAAGKRYVLFLEPGPEGFYRVVGFHQGCYPLVSGKDGKTRVAPRLAGANLLGGGVEAAVEGQSLSDFLARIRYNLKQAGR